MWLRESKPVWWLLPGMVSLALFAWLLTLVDSSAAGRAYAPYGGVYICASLAWLWAIEGIRPDRWHVAGAVVRIIGAHADYFRAANYLSECILYDAAPARVFRPTRPK